MKATLSTKFAADATSLMRDIRDVLSRINVRPVFGINMRAIVEEHCVDFVAERPVAERDSGEEFTLHTAGSLSNHLFRTMDEAGYLDCVVRCLRGVYRDL